MLKGSGVVPILRILQSFEAGDGVYRDEQIVRIAGIVETVRMKTTRNNSMMAYVTLEDDTAAMELLVFSNVIAKRGELLKENTPVVLEGRLSVRDEKAPQMVVNEVRAMNEVAKPAPKQLYLRIPTEGCEEDERTRNLLRSRPGNTRAILYFADSGIKRGTNCAADEPLLAELRKILGETSVVLK
jgi:DNA polymerase-3 subunit alpha